MDTIYGFFTGGANTTKDLNWTKKVNFLRQQHASKSFCKIQLIIITCPAYQLCKLRRSADKGKWQQFSFLQLLPKYKSMKLLYLYPLLKLEYMCYL